MRLGQTSLIYVVTKVLGSALGFLATIYFTRTLGEEIYGFYVITLAVVSWLGIIKSIGFGKAIVKRMSEGEESDAYLTAGTVIKAVLTGIVSIGVLIFNRQINAYVGYPVAEFVVLLLLVSIFSELVNASLQGTHQVHYSAIIKMVSKIVRSVLMIGLVYLGLEIVGMFLGYIIGTALISAVGFLIVQPKFAMPNWRHFRGLLDFAKFYWLGGMRSKSFNEMDILILGIFVPAGLTGIYAAAYGISKFLDAFGDAIKTTFFPEISKRAAAGDDDMIQSLTNDAITYAGIFLIPGTIGAAILGDRLMLIYGDNFDLGAQVLVILLVGILVYSYNKQLLNTLNAIDRPDLAFQANAAFVISNFVLNLVIVYLFGWVGAAIATTISAGIGLIFGYNHTRRHVSFTIPFGEISRQWTAAVGMGVVVYATRQLTEANWMWINDYNAVFVVGLVGLGALVYFVLLFGISKEFRSTVANNLPADIPVIEK